MAPLSDKKDRGTSKLCFTHKDQSVRLNFELSYNERRTLVYEIKWLLPKEFSKVAMTNACRDKFF